MDNSWTPYKKVEVLKRVEQTTSNSAATFEQMCENIYNTLIKKEDK